VVVGGIMMTAKAGICGTLHPRSFLTYVIDPTPPGPAGASPHRYETAGKALPVGDALVHA